MVNPTHRGLFIVLEGIDRSGKSSQTKRIIEFLSSRGWSVQSMRFPDRSTKIGSVIDAYLKGENKISPECLHLLFSANRWECQNVIESYLHSGQSVVCDRYCYSGIAYSVGVHNLDYDWCYNSEMGLVKPDVVYQIDADPSECSRRNSYGNESYEKVDIQQNVREAYKKFHGYKNWVLINSSTLDEVSKNIYDNIVNSLPAEGITENLLSRI